MDELRMLGLYDNSLIILTSDHGEEFVEHGGLSHGYTLYEEQLHIPLIIFPTSLIPEAPREIDATVGLIDLYPTLSDWFALGITEQSQGMSLKPLILDQKNAGTPARNYLYSETDLKNSIRSIRLDGKWKYIENISHGTAELYDLSDDPDEKKSILADRPVLGKDLANLLHDHFEEIESTAVTADKVVLDEWTKQSLKAMGYLD